MDKDNWVTRLDKKVDSVDRILRRGEVAEPHWVVHKLAASPGQLNHMIFCPACKCGHGFDTDRWVFNGDMVKPTLSALPGHTCSVMVQHRRQGLQVVCHYHINDGMIEFCNDCSHDMRGKTVQLEPF